MTGQELFAHLAQGDELAQLRTERDALRARVAELYYCLSELTALVRGECPSLLNEDSGGDAALSERLTSALAVPPHAGDE